jgi:hypothetical protein
VKLRLLAFAGAAVLALAACGGESDGTFDFEGFPFTFSYPADFEETEEISDASQSVGSSPEATVGIGLDDQNGIVVQRYPLRVEVTEQNIPRLKPEVDNIVRQLDPQAGQTELTEVDGRPAVVADGLAVASIEGGLSDITFIFEGDQEYLLNCQSTPDNREAVKEACDMAMDTLEFE